MTSLRQTFFVEKDRGFVLLNNTELNRESVSCTAFRCLAQSRMSPLSW